MATITLVYEVQSGSGHGGKGFTTQFKLKSSSLPADFGAMTVTSYTAVMTTGRTSDARHDNNLLYIYGKLNGTNYHLGRFIQPKRAGLHSYENFDYFSNSERNSRLGKYIPTNVYSIVHNGYMAVNSGSLLTITMTAKLDNAKSSSKISHSAIDIGNNLTISLSGIKVSSNTHKLTFKLGNSTLASFTMGAGVASYVYTLPMSWCSSITTATSASISLTVETIDAGGSSLGTNSHSFTARVPSSVRPTVTIFTASAINGVGGKYLQGVSRASLAASASASYGSAIDRWTITGGGLSANKATATTAVLQTAGTITYTATVTDKRGRTGTKTVSIKVLAYARPKITSANVYRSDELGNKADDGTYISFDCVYSYSNPEGVNDGFKAYASYRQRNPDGNYINKTELISGERLTIGGGSVSPSKLYEARIELVDIAYGTSEITYIIPTESVLFDFKEDRAAIGMRATGAKQFQLPHDWNIVGANYDGATILNKLLSVLTANDFKFSQQSGESVYLGVCYGVRNTLDVPISMAYEMTGNYNVTLYGHSGYNHWASYVNGSYEVATSASIITNRSDKRHFMIRLVFEENFFTVGSCYEVRGIWTATSS